MEKFISLVCLVLLVLSLTACSKSRIGADAYWEREKLSSNLYLNGVRAKKLLDKDIAECITITKNRVEIEAKSVSTKKCAMKDAYDWEQIDDTDFLRQCMRERGWVPSNCCAFSKDCACD